MRGQDTMMKRLTHALGALAVAALATPACDAPGGSGKSAIAPDVTRDASSGDALFPQPDATPDATSTTDSAPPTDAPTTATTIADTSQAETSPVDTSTSACEDGCLAVTPEAGPVVVFTQHATTVVPPTLTGGATPAGGWRVASVDIYPYGTFAEGFVVDIFNQGGTRGRAVFQGDAMQIALHLDLRIRVDAFGTVAEDTGVSDVALGGCFEAAQGLIEGDFETCATGWPLGTSPPSELGFAYASTLKLALELPPEYLIAMLPEEQQAAAAFVIIGPLTLVTTLVAQ
ncbi:MAG: hypothetical protein IT385_06550 [Deltaproteobacteria bacterium]|nr:hypothetical protein [Deltaproteobacteria bacterium]